jgi:hypothetical protein
MTQGITRWPTRVAKFSVTSPAVSEQHHVETGKLARH